MSKIAVGFLLLASLIACDSGDRFIKNKVVVRVGDQTLTNQQFAKELARKLKDYDALSAKDPSIVFRAKNQVVETFIIEALTSIFAKENEIFVKKEELDAETNKIIKSYPNDLSFKRALADENLSMTEWKSKIVASIIQNKVNKKINSGIETPDEKTIKKYYRANRSRFRRPRQAKIRQILLETENNAKRIKKSLRSGASFSELARKYSLSPESKEDGLVGWVAEGATSTFKKAFSQGVGTVSNVFKSPLGYHLVKVEERRSAKTLPLESVKSEIVDEILQKKKQTAYKAWLEGELKKSKVYRDDELIKALDVVTND